MVVAIELQLFSQYQRHVSESRLDAKTKAAGVNHVQAQRFHVSLRRRAAGPKIEDD